MPDLKQAASMIITDIDCHVVKNADQRKRNHLGASEIGDECSRKLWYKFRWVANKKFAGRMLRLFQRGHNEEPTFVKLLEQAGWTLTDIDPATGKQYHFSELWGHFGGSTDGIGTPPPDSQYAWLGPVVLEFKTSADKYHKKLTGDNVHIEQPKHDAQMQLYGNAFGVEHAVYMSVSKDNDNLYCQVVPVSKERAHGFIEKANAIIFAKEAPPKIAADPTFWKCKFCDFSATCHYNKAADKNCRSCTHCRPVQDAQWHCDLHNQVIPKDRIDVEYPCWESLI